MSGQAPIALSSADFHQFLNNGFIIQKPESNTIWIGIGQSDNEEVTFFHSLFYGGQTAQKHPKKLISATVDEFKSWVNSNLNGKCILEEQKNFDRDYQDDVSQMIGWIHGNKRLEKLVAVTRASYNSKNGVHPISRLEELLKLNGLIYGQWSQLGGFLGISPEPLFVQKDSGSWKTLALAGTISTSEPDYKNKLLQDEKELEEHNLVIEDIQNKLFGHCKSIDIGKTYCFNFGPFAHLKTDIEFKEDSLGYQNLVELLSPTAALGGYPSDITASFLKRLKYYNLEKDQRFFGGVFGFEFQEECFGLVAIRNLIWQNDCYYIHSGSGIVKESTVENELAEVRRKRNSIAKIFQGEPNE